MYLELLQLKINTFQQEKMDAWEQAVQSHKTQLQNAVTAQHIKVSFLKCQFKTIIPYLGKPWTNNMK